MPRAEPKPPKPIQSYGLPLLQGPLHTQLNYERMAFRRKWPIEKGGLPRYQHFRNGCRILWPWLKWNPWMERQAEVFCDNSWSAVAGCAGSSKTTVSVIYGVFWWLCGIQDSAFILTSTTKGNIRSRAWNWVQKLYTGIEGPRIGNMVDSRTTWQGVKHDDRHCVCALPVREGSTNKAVGRLQGFHPDGRMLIVIDEATDTPEAIFDSMANLIAGNWDFQVIALGNPNSRFDPFGKFITPLKGWSDVTVDDEEWETEVKLNGKPGIALHFDAEKSPNVIAGQVLFDYLPTTKSIEAARKKLGSESPWYYKFWRGFLPPEGVIQTVLTESLLEKFKAVGKEHQHIFTGERLFKVAGCDPAFGGGDRAILKFATCGVLEDGAVGIQLGNRVPLTINMKMVNETPVHYQLAQQIKWHCEQEGVPPGNFAIDSTGEGGGLADILWREWSSEIIRVEFGGKPSEERVSNEDNRPCDEAYTYKIAELWFLVKELVTSGQLRGMAHDEATEFCNRLWKIKGRKIDLEPKSRRKGTGDAVEESNWGMKERYGKSPDLADAVAVLCQAAKRHGAVVKFTGRTAKISDDWMRVARKIDDIYAEPEESQWPTNNPVDIYALEEV